ncbi:MAG: BamA/TamA family outer membrane protein [Bacteroidales bacterium]|nr:BamA/TamA family outer membrane protein [Bacteroidales bacterium]
MQIYRRKLLIYVILNILCCITLYAQESYYVSDIVISGNKVTKESIVLRELDVKKGDSISVSRIEQAITHSKENLLNLPLFNYVDIDYELMQNSDNNIIISIRLEERWYYIPLLGIRFADQNHSAWIRDFDLSRVAVETGAIINNVLGLNHTLTLGVQFGYQQALNFSYKKITLDRAQKHFLAAGISMQRSKNIIAMTTDDMPLKVKSFDQALSMGGGGYLSYAYRHNVRVSHNLSLGFEHERIADTILLINPIYWGSPSTERNSFRLQYFFRNDQRDYAAFPLKGYYLRTEGNLYFTHDLSVRYTQLKGSAQYFWTLGNRWYAGEIFTAGVSLKNTKAYILDRALSYGENVLRGYEYHVVDGQCFALLNSTLRYNLIPQKIIVVDWLSAFPKFNKIHYAFYAHAFADMGAAFHSYPGPTNYLSNQFLYSAGIGIDMVTYYDVVFTISYFINKQVEKGVYFSFKLPIL